LWRKKRRWPERVQAIEWIGQRGIHQFKTIWELFSAVGLGVIGSPVRILGD
jgi:hypothetical protein